MKIYKIRHKPTGLFYTPSKYRTGTFSLKGKVYQNKPKVEQMCTTRFPLAFVNGYSSKGKIYKKLKEHYPNLEGKRRECFSVMYNEWEVIEYDVIL